MEKKDDSTSAGEVALFASADPLGISSVEIVLKRECKMCGALRNRCELEESCKFVKYYQIKRRFIS